MKGWNNVIKDSGERKESETVKRFSCVQLFVMPWTVAYQAPLSMGFLK